MKTHPFGSLARGLPLAVALALACTLAPAARALGGGRDQETSKQHLLRLTLRGSMSDNGAVEFGLFSGPERGLVLRDVLAQIRGAAASDEVRGLVVRLKGASLGWSQRDAIRRALLDYRKTGKPSYCLLEGAGLGDMIVSTACTDVSLVPAGVIEMPGVSLQKIYFKGLLEKLGIRMQELRMGRYKSAVEPFTRKGSSDPVREETNALLDELYDDAVHALAQNLGKKPVEIRALIDHSLFSAREALEAGLVQHVEYGDAWLARIRGAEKLPIREAGKKGATPFELQGMAGLMTLLNEIFAPPVEAESKNPKIAVIYATGAIESGGAPSPLSFGGERITSDRMVSLFRKVRGDGTVKAVVFRVNSPGGSALASDLIAREVKRTAETKPVVVSMGDLAASGGYYISAPASWIVAENATLTGSIGVIGGILDLHGIYDRAGVRIETFSRGKRAQMVSSYGTLSEEARGILMRHMRGVYDTFLEIVSQGRHLPKDAVASVAEGRVWTGGQARKLGLVDQIGTLDDAVAKAKALAGVPESIELKYLPKPRTFMDLLMEMSGEGVRSGVLAGAVSVLPREIRSILARLEWVGILRRERVLAVMPDLYEIR